MLSKKKTALLNWIICETGVENYTFDKKNVSNYITNI